MRELTISVLIAGLLSPAALWARADERVERLAEERQKWLLEEVPYIISAVEREAFLNLSSERERDAFVEAFWRKRDENPSTVENEYRDEHYRRLAYANEFFGRDTFREGWQTDRGRYHILIGPPRNRQTFDGSDAVYPSELWFYDNPDLKRYGLPPFFFLLFFRRHGTGELELYSPVADGPQALLTGTDVRSPDFRRDVERAYEKLFEVDPELAQASLSFRTDEGDTAQFSAVSFGTLALLDQIVKVPFFGLDTSYAERLDFERGAVEADYLFRYVPSVASAQALPGPDGASFVHWVIELAPENVAFVMDQKTRELGSRFIITVEAVPRDDPDKVVLQSRNESFVRLKESERASLHRPFAYSGMAPLVPGAYQLRVILRNRACPSRDEKDCFKSYTLLDQEVVVPAFAADGQNGLGEIVLGYGTISRKEPDLYRAYRFGNVEILPNPSGVYSIGETMTVALHLGSAGSSHLRLRVVDDEPHGGTHLDETVSLNERQVAPLVQELSLESIQGGRFRLVAELVGPEGRPLGQSSTPFTVSPRTSIPRPLLRGAAPQVRPEVPALVDSALGEQYLALGKPEKARERFETALRVNPKLGIAREKLAEIALGEGDFEAVIALLAPVYAEVTDRYEVLVPLGEAYFRSGDFARASEVLEKALPLRRPQPALLNTLSRAQHRLGNAERALELLRHSLEIDPAQEGLKELVEKLEAERSSR